MHIEAKIKTGVGLEQLLEEIRASEALTTEAIIRELLGLMDKEGVPEVSLSDGRFAFTLPSAKGSVTCTEEKQTSMSPPNWLDILNHLKRATRDRGSIERVAREVGVGYSTLRRLRELSFSINTLNQLHDWHIRTGGLQ